MSRKFKVRLFCSTVESVLLHVYEASTLTKRCQYIDRIISAIKLIKVTDKIRERQMKQWGTATARASLQFGVVDPRTRQTSQRTSSEKLQTATGGGNWSGSIRHRHGVGEPETVDGGCTIST